MSRIIKLMKKIKIKNIVLLILLLIFNTYAWFIFATKASLDLSVHVSGWQINFKENNEEIVKDIQIKVDRAFPGMMNFEKIIEAENTGETNSTLRYEITAIRIFDLEYIVGENISEIELKEKIKNEFPFKINFIINDFGTILDDAKKASFKIQLEWPFESGKDQLDTLWGNKSYDFYSNNLNKNAIEIKVKLIAEQKN